VRCRAEAPSKAPGGSGRCTTHASARRGEWCHWQSWWPVIAVALLQGRAHLARWHRTGQTGAGYNVERWLSSSGPYSLRLPSDARSSMGCTFAAAPWQLASRAPSAIVTSMHASLSSYVFVICMQVVMPFDTHAMIHSTVTRLIHHVATLQATQRNQRWSADAPLVLFIN
jgi:hypothetical protein